VAPVIHPTIAQPAIAAPALRAGVACARMPVERTMIVLTAVAAMAAVVFGPASATRNALGAKLVRRLTLFASINDRQPVDATQLAPQEDTKNQPIHLKTNFGFASAARVSARVVRPRLCRPE